MADINSDLTVKARAFIKAFVQYGAVIPAASAAGCTETYGHMLLRDPRMAGAIRLEVARLLATDGAVTGYRTLKTIAQDSCSPAAARVSAARVLLSMAGYDGGGDKAAAPAKALTEMSAEELRTLIAAHEREINAIEGQLAAKATPVDAPSPLALEAQVVDPLA